MPTPWSDFKTVRRLYFPRWDKARSWRFRSFPNNDTRDGLCDPATRTIYVRPNVPQRIGTIIHEICHAIAVHANHGNPWQKRMLRAAAHATRLGENGIAEFLQSEVKQFGSEMLTARAVYSEIQDAVFDLPGRPRFRQVIGVVSRNLGLKPATLKREYPRCRVVYEDALRQKIEMLEFSMASVCSDVFGALPAESNSRFP
jgi:hypothetical protein